MGDIQTCALGDCDLPASPDVFSDNKRRRRYCSTSHLRADVHRRAAQPRCPVCREKFTRTPGPGRPGIYCSAKCAKIRQGELDLAVKELARGDMSGDKVKLLHRAELLATVWLAGHASSLYMDKITARCWAGSKAPKPTSPPNRDARNALINRLNDLNHVVALDRREHRDAEARKAYRAAEKRKEEILAAQRRDNERAWKDRVAAGVPLDGVVIDDD